MVPDSVVSALSGDHFTLQLWMRRGGANIQPATTQSRGSRKEEETIVCSTVKNGASCHRHVCFFSPTQLPRIKKKVTAGQKKKQFIASRTSFKVLLRETLNPKCTEPGEQKNPGLSLAEYCVNICNFMT